MTTVTSRHNPVVRAFRDLAAHPDPRGARLLLDGAHLVHDAVERGLPFETVCVAVSRLEQPGEARVLADALRASGHEVITVADQVFATISPVRSPSGIAAIVSRTPTETADLLAAADPFLVAAFDIQDPGNVGALVRVAEAAGVSGVFVGGASANPFSWKALRGSMGSALRLPIVHGLPVPQVQTSLRHAHVRTVAAIPRGGADPDTIRWRGPVAILLGGEGPGLSDDVIAACDQRVTIPMTAPVESLNVSAAAAILLYTARRHRR
jgi:TrmH family RNA methyltransferase